MFGLVNTFHGLLWALLGFCFGFFVVGLFFFFFFFWPCSMACEI